MFTRLGLTFAVLLVAAPAWAQSGSRNVVPLPAPSSNDSFQQLPAPPPAGSGTRNSVPNFAPAPAPSNGSGTRNSVPSFDPTYQPPFSQLPNEAPPVQFHCGSGGCSTGQGQYLPSYSQPSFQSTPYYSSGFSGGGCSAQPSYQSSYQPSYRPVYRPQTSYYTDRYYQPRFQPRYHSSCR